MLGEGGVVGLYRPWAVMSKYASPVFALRLWIFLHGVLSCVEGDFDPTLVVLLQ